jgi:hypothetical protein
MGFSNRAALLLSLAAFAPTACDGKSLASNDDGGSGSGSSSGSDGSSGSSSGRSSGGAIDASLNGSSSSGSSSSSGGGTEPFSCGASADGGTTQPAAIVGTWTYSGSVPDLVNVTLTLCADGSFSFAEQVAPATTPAGGGDGGGGCVTTDTYQGVYGTSVGGGEVKWAFETGTANAISGCADVSENSPGIAMTSAAIESYRSQGLIPPPQEAYTTTATTLVLTPLDDTGGGVGFSDSVKTFTKAQ